MGFQEDVVSRARTFGVRIVAATVLALSACLVAWWPQSASGSGDVAVQPAAALATQKTPSQNPTPTVAPPPPPETAAPPPAPAPTSKPTKKPNHDGGHNNGGSNGSGTKPPQMSNGSHGGGGGGSKPPPSNNHGSSGSNTSSSVVTHTTSTGTTEQAPPPAPTETPPPTRHTHTAAPTTEAVAPPSEPTASPSPIVTDTASGDVTQYDTYLSSSEPVEAKSAPVWVVPGILLVLTSMLALLGGVLGRNSRPLPGLVKGTGEPDPEVDGS